MKVRDTTYLEMCAVGSEPIEKRIVHASDFKGYDGELHTVYDEEATRRLGVKMYRTIKPFRFYYDTDEGRRWVFVPEGFLTDGASVPKLLQWLIRPWGRHGQAAVVHDLLCIYRTSFKFRHEINVIKPVLISNYETHWVFLEAMRVSGVSIIKRNVMYWAVRAYFLFRGLRNKGPLEAIDKMELRKIYRERNVIS